MSAALALAKRALQHGDPAAAARSLHALAQREPRNAEILRLLGMALNAQERYADALAYLRKAVELDPANALVFNSLGNALGHLGDKTAAVAAFAHACALAPQVAQFQYNLGKALNEDARPDAALVPLQAAVTLAPDDLRAQYLLAQTERVTGYTDIAARHYRQLLEGHPERAEAWLGLAGLQRLQFSAVDVDAMERTLRCELNDDDAISIRFALARGYEGSQRYPEAIAMYRDANARERRHCSWDAGHFSRRVDEFLDTVNAPVSASADAQGAEVVFIVSMPRSGSSLTEQILASHHQVDGAGELPDLPAILHAESARRGESLPAWFAKASAQDWQRLGQEYLQRTARWRAQRPHFTDKMPDNWRFVGVALAMLPAARVIVCRRDPVETCLACFRQLFTRGGQAFSYDLDDIAAYWRDFDRAVRHWQMSCPDRVHTQSYEALVADPETQIRALLQFCRLPFDPACLNFHETRRNVSTASAAQVREPLRVDTARAPAYGVLLDPLRMALGVVRQSDRKQE
ncbi:MAG: tetratricopeptide repeat-containing sulfotransferase family protein [Rudaea sp.]